MPYLMVNLDDAADCRRALEHLRERAERCGPRACVEPPRRHRGPARHRRPDFEEAVPEPTRVEPTRVEAAIVELPLRKKLERISHRGIWQYLVRIAVEINEPKSLPEIDALLDLVKNKMRSLKAIMGKLERRWRLRLLRAEPDAGLDESGNPRYIMPPHVRKQIQKMTE